METFARHVQETPRETVHETRAIVFNVFLETFHDTPRETVHETPHETFHDDRQSLNQGGVVVLGSGRAGA
eukprot:1960362-Pyramimonas_sp.AAC.1